MNNTTIQHITQIQQELTLESNSTFNINENVTIDIGNHTTVNTHETILNIAENQY